MLAACSIGSLSGSGWKKVGGEILEKVNGIFVLLLAIYMASSVLIL